MKTLVGILIGGATIIGVIAVDKALGISTKLVTLVGVTPK